MSVLVEIDDPDGRRVVLDQEGWDHILEGHAVMGPTEVPSWRR